MSDATITCSNCNTEHNHNSMADSPVPGAGNTPLCPTCHAEAQQGLADKEFRREDNTPYVVHTQVDLDRRG